MTPDFPARIRRERERLGLSQADAARLAGLSYDTYRQLERDVQDPRISTVASLLTAGFQLRAIAPDLAD